MQEIDEETLDALRDAAERAVSVADEFLPGTKPTWYHLAQRALSRINARTMQTKASQFLETIRTEGFLP